MVRKTLLIHTSTKSRNLDYCFLQNATLSKSCPWIRICPRSNEDKSRTSKFLPPSPISVKSNRVQLRAIRSEIAAEISCSLSSNLPHNPTLQSPQCDSEPHCLQSKSLGPPLSEIEQGLTSYLIPECPVITFPPNHQILPHLTL